MDLHQPMKSFFGKGSEYERLRCLGRVDRGRSHDTQELAKERARCVGGAI